MDVDIIKDWDIENRIVPHLRKRRKNLNSNHPTSLVIGKYAPKAAILEKTWVLCALAM